MPLTKTHLIFLALFALFLGGFGAWSLSDGLRAGAMGTVALAGLSVLSGCGTIAWGLYFARMAGEGGEA